MFEYSFDFSSFSSIENEEESSTGENETDSSTDGDNPDTNNNPFGSYSFSDWESVISEEIPSGNPFLEGSQLTISTEDGTYLLIDEEGGWYLSDDETVGDAVKSILLLMFLLTANYFLQFQLMLAI